MLNNIDIQIDRLILNGLPPTAGPAVQAALQATLSSLCRQHGITLHTAAETMRQLSLDNLTLNAPPAASPQMIGERLAQALFDKIAECQ